MSVTKSDKEGSFLKWPLTIFLLVLIPSYWIHYGPENFLWFSDVALFLTVIALWRHSRLINSMMLIGVLPFELIWNIGFFTRLLSGSEVWGLTGYMFDDKNPLFIRALSLFHVALPLIWLMLRRRWGYDSRAFVSQCVLFLTVTLFTYLLTSPEKNINWVFLPVTGGFADRVPMPVWLLLYVFSVPVLVFLPAHRLLGDHQDR